MNLFSMLIIRLKSNYMITIAQQETTYIIVTCNMNRHNCQRVHLSPIKGFDFYISGSNSILCIRSCVHAALCHNKTIHVNVNVTII